MKPALGQSWLELPGDWTADAEHCLTHYAQMQEQTYYSTNITPQIQNGFNGAIWAKLEETVRNAIPAGDTLYIITGASFRKTGGNEPVKTIVNKNDGKTLPVPNYYWKAVLKVKRAGNVVSDTMTVGFWLPHEFLTYSLVQDHR